MRNLDPALSAHLQGGVTTLCHCWRVRRRDGSVQGFTDHDRNLEFSGTLFNAQSGLEAAAAEQALGLAVGGADVAGVLQSGVLEESQLAAGDYDGARVETWRVNWAEPEQRLLLDISVLGEVRRTGEKFQAELRSLAHEFDQDRGRIYQPQCDADLGDLRCGVDLSSEQYTVTARIAGGDRQIEFALDTGGFEDGHFDGGKMFFLDGAFAGQVRALEQFRLRGAGSAVRLWTRMPGPAAIGTIVRLTAGCDKSLSMCRVKFANIERFRGFPHIPGNDALLANAATENATMDGGSLFR